MGRKLERLSYCSPLKPCAVLACKPLPVLTVFTFSHDHHHEIWKFGARLCRCGGGGVGRTYGEAGGGGTLWSRKHPPLQPSSPAAGCTVDSHYVTHRD